MHASLAAVSALEDAVHTFAAAFFAVRDPYETAQNIVTRVHPALSFGVPALGLINYVGAALKREGIDIHTFDGPSHTDSVFELGVPIRQVNANLSGMIERLREAHG